MTLAGLLELLRSYIMVRWHALVWRQRAHVERYRARRLNRFLAEDLPTVPAYRYLAGTNVVLSDLPLMSKSELMANFAAYNSAGVTLEAGWKAFEGSRRIGDFTVGASTGTSGNRGLFVISEAERFRWLGAMLAKALPDFWRKRYRVAIILPINTPLYDSANVSKTLTLKFFDVTTGPDSWSGELQKFNPHVIVSSPKILVWLTAHAPLLRPLKVFSAAETLDPVDRRQIERRFGTPLGQIYMATEGLLGVSCREGTLHLCDDTMFIELENTGDGLVSPIITDFSRSTQIMARYRMNDLLRLSDTPCKCGSPLRAVSEVIGRQDDVFRLDSCDDGKTIEITPDVLRNAIVDADRRIVDYRLIQEAAVSVRLVMPPDLDNQAVEAARIALSDIFDQRGAKAAISVQRSHLPLETRKKLRRIECRLAAGKTQ